MPLIHRLAPYGTFPHAQGDQHLTLQAAQQIVRHFHSLRGRLARRFRGLPLYLGHPDDPAFRDNPAHQDKTPYGTITELEARPDGLYATLHLHPHALDKLHRQPARHLSPRWETRPARQGGYHPLRLLSVGLTATPNIPNNPISLPQTTPQTTTTKSNPNPNAPNPNSRDREEPPEAPEATPQPQPKPPRTPSQHTRQLQEILTTAMQETRLAPHELSAWQERYADNPTAASQALANTTPQLPTTPLLPTQLPRQPHPQHLAQAAHDRMKSTGESFLQAWQNLKHA